MRAAPPAAPLPDHHGSPPPPDRATAWGPHTVSVGTGMPYSGCDAVCTVDGNVATGPETGSCAEAELWMGRAGRACQTRTCMIPHRPSCTGMESGRGGEGDAVDGRGWVRCLCAGWRRGRV